MRNLRDEARWIIGEIDEAKRLAKAVGKPQLGTSSIEAGRVEEYDQDGALVQIIGEQYDGTHAPVTVNGPTPPEPAGLSLTVGVGSVEARWNGKFAGDAVSPMDFSHVSLHGSRPEVFTPSNETQLATIAGELGDVATVILEPGEWTFGLVAVSKAGKWSEMSETVTVEIPDYPAPADIQDELIRFDEVTGGLITEAGNLGQRLDQAEADLTNHDGRLEQAETDVNTALSGDVDIDRLAIGNGVIRDLVAQHIAGKTAAFQQVDVKNLFVTTGTMTEAVINKLWADVVMSRKITAQMMAIGDFTNGCKNPGFEDGVLEPWYWSNASVALDIANAQSGGFCAKLVSASAAQARLFTNGPTNTRTVHPTAVYGKRYRFSAFVKGATGGEKFIVQIYFYTAAGAYLGTSSTPYTATTAYAEYSTQRDCPWIDASYYIGAVTTNEGVPGTTLFVDYGNLREMLAGELIVDGSVTAEKVAANAIKAYHADFDSFFADTGFVSQLRSKGIILVDETGAETVNLTGEGENFITIRDGATGDDLVTIDESGGMSAQSLAVSGDARFDGVLVANGDPLVENHLGGDDPGQWGPIFNGRSLLGATFTNYVDQHPAVSDVNSWLTPIPHGAVTNAWNDSAAGTNAAGRWVWEGKGGQYDYRMMLVTTQEFVSGRMYSLNYRTPAIRATDGKGGTLGRALLRYSTDGGSVSADSGSTVPGTGLYLSGGGEYVTPSALTYVRCPEDIPAGKIMLGAEVYVYDGRTAESTATAVERRWEITVVDMGLRRQANDGDAVNLRKQGTDPTPTPPAPKPPKPKQYTETIGASWWQAYTGDNSQATHSTYSGAAAQGRTPYAPGNGVMRGLIGFPSQASRLSGATVKKIEVYVHAKSWHAGAGGTAVIGTHTHGSKPGSWSSSSNDVKRQKMKRGEGRWITLPSSVHAGFKSGSLRGISFYPPGGSSSTEYYGIFTGNKTRLRVTYTK